MSSTLKEVTQLVQELEKDREQKFGALDAQLRLTAEETVRLRETAGQLREALATKKYRGQSE